MLSQPNSPSISPTTSLTPLLVNWHCWISPIPGRLLRGILSGLCSSPVSISMLLIANRTLLLLPPSQHYILLDLSPTQQASPLQEATLHQVCAEAVPVLEHWPTSSGVRESWIWPWPGNSGSWSSRWASWWGPRAGAGECPTAGIVSEGASAIGPQKVLCVLQGGSQVP